jgi:integrase
VQVGAERTRQPQPHSPDNFRSRVLGGSVRRANKTLTKGKQPPLPDGLTPHSLRRTFCSVLYALSENPTVVMQEMSHRIRRFP